MAQQRGPADKKAAFARVDERHRGRASGESAPQGKERRALFSPSLSPVGRSTFSPSPRPPRSETAARHGPARPGQSGSPGVWRQRGEARAEGLEGDEGGGRPPPALPPSAWRGSEAATQLEQPRISSGVSNRRLHNKPDDGPPLARRTEPRHSRTEPAAQPFAPSAKRLLSPAPPPPTVPASEAGVAAWAAPLAFLPSEEQHLSRFRSSSFKESWRAP